MVVVASDEGRVYAGKEDGMISPVFIIVKTDKLSVQWALGSMKGRRESFQSMVMRFRFVLAARRCGGTPRPFALRVTVENGYALIRLLKRTGTYMHPSNPAQSFSEQRW